ncbi:MBL fold metallo-hydrolase [Lacrimispora sp. 38-1]|uniref:MBL fold metallo-hydrolase n=1 Tax=Lacrimispora sp. 38-1 TaxID=3125778 RepID=UPI003CE72AD1
MTDYYKTEKINENMTAIFSRSGEIMYLIEGTDRAALVDTCLGVKGLRKLVEELTQKPITVLLTHGHLDHALGAPEFDDVYMNSKDNEVYKQHSPLAERKGYIAANIGGMEEWLQNDDNFVPVTDPDFKELWDGAIFDLGGITVEVYELAGHTKGTMVLLIAEKEILITGDACNTATFLFDDNSLTVDEYRKNLLRVENLIAGRYERCYFMHHEMVASRNLLENVIAVCDDILIGNTDNQEFPFRGTVNYVAKAADRQFKRADGGEGNVIFNKKKIFREG